MQGFNNMAMSFHKVRVFTDSEVDSIREKIIYLAGDEDPFQKLGGKAALQAYPMKAVFYPDAGYGLNHELAEEINQKLLEELK